MPKYKYLLIFFSGLVLLLLCFCCSVSFDNNDDQAMFFINSGVLSGIPSANIVHTNLIIGSIIKKLFHLNNQVNWYTLYLQVIQLISFLTIFYVLIYNKKTTFPVSGLLLFFFVSGFAALCTVKIQYTTVAILSCAAALLCIQSELPGKRRFLLALFFILLSILVRRDSFYIFIAFNAPIIFLKSIKKQVDKSHFILLGIAVVLFFTLNYINDNDAVYKKAETYKYLKVLDDVIDKPVNYTTADLNKFGFTEDDMLLLKARYPASERYNTGENITGLSKQIKTKRTINEIVYELKKFVVDERYMVLVYFLSIVLVLFFTQRPSRIMMFLNLLVFLALLLYLAASMRIPHRVTLPMLIFVSISNLGLLVNADIRNTIKVSVLGIFVLIGVYKFYCTYKLIKLQSEYHAKFTACANEINAHPNNFFISLHDGFPIEFMDAWQAPGGLFPKNNLIMTGWNVWAPDFQTILEHHQLKDITADLEQKRNVLFITYSKEYTKAFMKVMKQRYNVTCHFEDAQNGFTELHPQRLVFDR